MPQIHAFLNVDRWHRPCEPESTMTRHSRLIAGTGNGSRFVSYVSRTGWITGATGILSVPSVPDATYVTANTRGTQATVYWSSSTPVLILGASYNVNEAIGAATVVFKGSEGITTGSQRAA